MRARSKPTVAIVHGLLDAGNGGSEARAIWAVEALKDDFAVSLVAPGFISLERLNEAYGTAITREQVRVCSLPIPRIPTHKRAPSALRGAFASRALRSVIHEHDILISTYNFSNFGRPGIHCVADFSWHTDLRRRFDPSPQGIRGWYHRVGWLRYLYLCVCQAIASSPAARNRLSDGGVIVANSEWTAARLTELHGIPPLVVYPPVAGHFDHSAQTKNSNDFVCIGRISSEKRIERMVDIIGAVRNRGHDVKLRIVGPFDSSHYAKTISALVRPRRNWAILEGRVVGEAKERLLAECRYGIHGREGEAFGIGVAEMVKAGCITFAPAEGGPAEILKHEALLYCSDNDAVNKIIAVLTCESLRSELAAHLKRQARRFSPGEFMSGLRSAVRAFEALSDPPYAPEVIGRAAAK